MTQRAKGMRSRGTTLLLSLVISRNNPQCVLKSGIKLSYHYNTGTFSPTLHSGLTTCGHPAAPRHRVFRESSENLERSSGTSSGPVMNIMDHFMKNKLSL